MATDFGVPFRFSLSDCFFRWGFEFLEGFFFIFWFKLSDHATQGGRLRDYGEYCACYIQIQRR